MANPLICVFNPITTLIDQIASVSSGPGVAGTPVVLNANGLLDPTLIGTGITAIAGESVSGGRLVNLYSLGGVLHMQNAYAASGGTAPSGATYPVSAIGFVTSGALINNTSLVQFSGVFTYADPNAEFSSADVSAEVYLSASSPQSANAGGITKTRPSGGGQLQQTVGTVVGFTAPNFVQVAFTSVPNPPLLNFSNIATGVNTAATMTLGTGATMTFSGSGIINANELTGDPVNTSGRTTGQALVWNGTAWAPSGSASVAFSGITSGTNTTAAMVVGSGASITVSGSGSITATQLATTGAAVVVSSAAPPTVGQTLTATSATTAAWMSGGGGTPGGTNGEIQFNDSGTFNGAPFSFVNTSTGATAIGVSTRTPTSTTGFTVNGAGAHPIQEWYSSNEGFVVSNLDYRGILFSQGVEINNTINFAEPALKVTGGGSGSPDIAQFITSVSSVPSATKVVFVDFNGNLNLAEGIKDSTGSLGTSGQSLTSTGSLTLWANPPAAAGGSPTQIQYNLGSVLAGIAGSAVTATGGVTLAPTGVVVGLTVTGEATGADDIAHFNASVAGGSGTTVITSGGGASITVDTAFGAALNVSGSTFLSAAAVTSPTTPLIVTGDTFNTQPLFQIFKGSPNIEVLRLNELAHLTIEPSQVIGTETFATLTAVGDTAANDIFRLVAYNGGTPVLVNSVDQYGSVTITPAPAATAAGLVVNGDGTNNAVNVFDSTLVGSPTMQILPANGNQYATTVFGQGSLASTDQQLEVTVHVTTDDTFAPSTVWNSIENDLTITPTSPSTNNWTGITTKVTANGTQAFSGSVDGFDIFVEGASTGLITALNGMMVSVQEAGSGGASQITGISSSVAAITSVTTLLAAQLLVANNTPAVTTTATALDIESPGFISGSTVTHAYGIHIENQETPLVAGNADPWAIKVEGGVSGFTGLATAIVTKTTTYTATRNDHTINCNGTFTLTLDATGQGYKVGQEFYIKNIGTGVITVSSSVNIDGALTALLNTQYQSITVQWDGTQYWIY